ncbi:uncharacterized protein LOC110683265 [Chenopodium quinoa]|uniref:uncharacterized protein LOC110683265 n=1 Tax=Chenopodium quinoa TaxID=63459 RepID=UPI000B78854D|nr:uncharacterized protein LOC110683265 [Chenopodium quinoa]
MTSVDNVAQKLASLPFLGCCGMDVVGLSGGLFICFFLAFSLVPVYASQNVYLCKLVQGDEIKHVMFVYGSPHITNRLEIWYLISNLMDTISNVVIIGDFNQVEYSSDKLGGNFSIPGQWDFMKWRIGLDLVDVPFSGPRYNWTNNRLDSDPIFERLDRAYRFSTWFTNYPDTKLLHQPILFSDHAAVILSDSADSDFSKRPYRVENWCLSAPAIHNIIASVFSLFFPGSLMFALSPSQTLCSRADRCLFISTKNERIAEAQAAYIFWQQRAKTKWDDLGDSHSRLLFSKFQSRKRKNKILGLRDSTGCWHQDTAQINSITLHFYKELYSASPEISTSDTDWWDSLCLPSLSSTQRAFLMEPFTSEEIRSAIFSINDGKSPGPDGFPSTFFKSSWQLVGQSVVVAVQHFFVHGYMLKDWNRTFLTLLPKVDNLEFISQFRPIGLCNVIYKCVAKCLTSRIRQVLPSLVVNYQNAFVPGRLLSDNALIAHEVLSFMNKSKAKKKFFAALKLDMNKDYDRVNWDFLFRLLQAYGFPPYWIHIIRQCVSTVSYQVLVNGNPLPTFFPQCGLRQGDPLSSYLFVLCMEVLSAMIRRAERASLLKGICIPWNAPTISHLFFADDSLLFLQVSPEACENLMTLLSEFCSLSGQVINLQKSFVKFSPNTPTDYRDFLSRSLKLQCKSTLGSYLGVPVELGRSKVADFGFLIDKVVQRLSAFASLGLSSAAKLIIINSVLVASFNHILSIFKVPLSICSKVDGLLARFWWRSDHRSRGLALRSSTLLHLPKGLGGLGIRQLQSFNSVLLARQCWRIHHNPQLLVSRTLSARYPSLRLFQTRRIPGSSWGVKAFYRVSLLRHAVTSSRLLFQGFWLNFFMVEGFLGFAAFAKVTIILLEAPSKCASPNGILQQRGIPVEATCVLCRGSYESVAHLFRDCSFVSDIWTSVPLLSSLVIRRDVHFHDWVSRCSAVDDFRASARLTGVASGAIRQLPLSSCYLMGSSDSSADVFLLIDGAYNSRDNTTRAGWIFRSPHSATVLEGGSRAFLSSSAFQSELQACFWALQAADHRAFQHLLIYTDCSSLLSFLGNDGCRDISCLWLLQDIRNLVSRFSSCVVQKVPRQWVAPAHWLATQARQRHLLLWSF